MNRLVVEKSNLDKTILIGAAIDACAGTSGAKDTPYIVNDILKQELDKTFDNILDYQGHGKDILKLNSYYTQLAVATKQALKQNKLPIIIGGDHSCAIGSWSGVSDYLSDQNQNLGIIWVDAHMDSHTPETSVSGNIHGMPIASLLGFGYPELISILNNNPKLDPKNIILVGVRSFEEGEAKLLAKLGVKIYYNYDLQTQDIETIIKQSWQELSSRVDKIGFSLDLDGFDPTYAPGVGTCEPNGVDFNQFMNIIPKLNLEKLIAVEVSEGNQHLDSSPKTIGCIIRIIKEFMKYGTK